MKSFKDLNIKAQESTFVGEKISINKVLNCEIIVDKYDIKPSKHNSGQCLTLQIQFKNKKHIIFTGSGTLIEMIKQVHKEDFPFTTTIIDDNERFVFT